MAMDGGAVSSLTPKTKTLLGEGPLVLKPELEAALINDWALLQIGVLVHLFRGSGLWAFM